MWTPRVRTTAPCVTQKSWQSHEVRSFELRPMWVCIPRISTDDRLDWTGWDVAMLTLSRSVNKRWPRANKAAHATLCQSSRVDLSIAQRQTVVAVNRRRSCKQAFSRGVLLCQWFLNGVIDIPELILNYLAVTTVARLQGFACQLLSYSENGIDLGLQPQFSPNSRKRETLKDVRPWLDEAKEVLELFGTSSGWKNRRSVKTVIVGNLQGDRRHDIPTRWH